jgi:hypothetical protein
MTSRSEPALRPDPGSLHGRLLWEARVMRLERAVEVEHASRRDLAEYVQSLETRVIALEAAKDAEA